MSKPASLRRRLGLAGIVVPLVLAGGLTGCGAQFHAMTGATYVPGQGNFADTGDMSLRAVVAVSAVAGSASVTAVLLNNSSHPDALTAVTLAGGQAVLNPTPITVDGGAQRKVGLRVAGTTTTTVDLTGAMIKAGGLVDLTFAFANSPAVTVTTLVVANTGPYAGVPLPKTA